MIQNQPTESISQTVTRYLNLTKSDGSYALAEEQRTLLESASHSFSEQVAEEIKKLELVRIWSVISTLANQKKAEQVFGKEQTDYIRQSYLNNPHLFIDHIDRHLDGMLADTNIVFVACGGTVGSGNLFNSPIENILKSLFNNEEDYKNDPNLCRCSKESEPHFHCPGKSKETGKECNHPIAVGHGTKACPSCGMSATCA